MARDKDNSPLFDALRRRDGRRHRDVRPTERAGALPSQTGSQPHANSTPSVNSPPVSPATGPSTTNIEAMTRRGSMLPMRAVGNLGRWMRSPVEMKLGRGALLVGILLIGALTAGAYLIGYLMERERSEAQLSDYKKNLGPFAELRMVEPNRSLIPPYLMGNADEISSELALKSTQISENGLPASSDPRKIGLNYYRLEQYPEHGRSEAERAASFLKAKGVDAGLIVTKDGKKLFLFAFKGFVKTSSPEAREYRERLLTLGREWKAQHKGTSDWSTLFAKKHVLDIE